MYGSYPTQSIKTQPTHLSNYFMYVNSQNILQLVKWQKYPQMINKWVWVNLLDTQLKPN